MTRAAPVVLAIAALVAVAGCRSGDGTLTISAASSLKPALERAAPGAHFSFAGSDELAAQIRRGARPDVYAAANTALPAALHREGLVEPPVVFAANRLVIAVPAGSDRIRSLSDLAEPGVTIAAGAATVPVGTYTRDVLGRLGGAAARRILANVRSDEPDVAGVVAKLVHGAADAGFVYATDVRAAAGALRAIEIPERLRPSVAYAAAVVRGADDAGAARAFLDELTGAAGREALRVAGFEAP